MWEIELMGFIGIHTGQKAERDTGSILLKPGTAKNSFQGMEQISGTLEKSRIVLTE